ncbi:hypothetical protein Dsin_025436 [Dipteronia sinensis]|uniref:Uncharacterized protein n=1 Tax=Dipteronia sinensis TaxID=43782 RepID=A0AAD9ZW04_9ROSI|nr:hypothetical protein Dsin_025436 [Dipteronia sinensis]
MNPTTSSLFAYPETTGTFESGQTQYELLNYGLTGGGERAEGGAEGAGQNLGELQLLFGQES